LNALHFVKKKNNSVLKNIYMELMETVSNLGQTLVPPRQQTGQVKWLPADFK